MNKDDYAAGFTLGLHVWDQQRDRSKQAQIGPSEVGFCRQKTALKIKEVTKSDSKPSPAARIGTAVHADLAVSRKALFPHLLIETKLSIVLNIPGYGMLTIVGHADEIDPTEPSVTDWKTVDGFDWVQRSGASKSHKFQRWLYALGAIQAGLVSDEGLVIRNVYIDRSGHEDGVHVEQELFDYMLQDEIIEWLSDVFYAVEHKEDASRDVVAPVCQAIGCEFFTVCRGGLPSTESDVYTDPDIVEAVQMYVEGREMATEGEKQRKAASKMLSGLNGVAAGFQVRTTHVNETDVPGFFRRGYDKVDIIPVRKQS